MWILLRGKKESWFLMKRSYIEGIPNLTQLVLTEEEQRDFESFALASRSVSQKGKKGKPPLWKVSPENPKFYSQAQQIQHQTDSIYTSQPIRSQAQAELCQLERVNAEAKKEIICMQRQIYNALKKRAIELALPWHSSTIQIAQGNHDIVSERLQNKVSKSGQALGFERLFHRLRLLCS